MELKRPADKKDNKRVSKCGQGMITELEAGEKPIRGTAGGVWQVLELEERQSLPRDKVRGKDTFNIVDFNINKYYLIILLNNNII